MITIALIQINDKHIERVYVSSLADSLEHIKQVYGENARVIKSYTTTKQKYFKKLFGKF